MQNDQNQLCKLINIWPDPDVCMVSVQKTPSVVVSCLLVGTGGAPPAYSDDRLAFHFLNDLSSAQDVMRLFGSGGVVRYQKYVVGEPATCNGSGFPEGSERESYMMFDRFPDGVGRFRVEPLSGPGGLATATYRERSKVVTRSYIYFYDRRRWWVRNPLTPEFGFQNLESVCVSRLN